MEKNFGILIKEGLAKIFPDLLYADGYDDCITGVTLRAGVPVVTYRSEKVIAKLAKDMPYEDAVEFFEYNIEGAYLGVRTPIFMSMDEELERIRLNEAIKNDT
jgi:hypothetical protein